jgi:hypothetical protein
LKRNVKFEIYPEVTVGLVLWGIPPSALMTTQERKFLLKPQKNQSACASIYKTNLSAPGFSSGFLAFILLLVKSKSIQGIFLGIGL